MSLDHKPVGNPNFKKGVVNNPNGRPKGSVDKKSHPSIKERLLGKWKTHPADKLVNLANFVAASDPELAAEIWTNLLKYFEPTKKPVESVPEKSTPKESKEAAEETFRLLQELENGSIQDGGDKEAGVETGPTQVPPEAIPEEDLRGYPEF
jgi:hypothetical protein